MKWVYRALRKLMGVPEPQINRDEALRIAQTEVEKRGLRMGIPAVYEGIKTWTVWIRSDCKGGPFVVIDSRTGQILKWVSPPR